MDDRYDIVIFGATGFTGKLTLEEVLRLCCGDQKPLTVAVAGRSIQKLQETVEKAGKGTGAKTDIPILVADAGDEESLTRMAKKARLILNCCGPYMFYGEQVVKACIAEGTHHIDVTGEPLYIQRLYLNYSEPAKEKGVYVVNACGYDCIPTDMGVVFLENNFPGILNSVEIYHQISFKDPSAKGPVSSMGSWTTLVNSLDKLFLSLRLERQIKQLQKIPECKPKLKTRLLPHKPPLIEKPSVLCPTWDKNAIEMTQAYLYQNEKKRPVQAIVYFVLKSYFTPLLLMFGSVILLILSKTRFTRQLLIKHPRFFTNGLVRKEDPSEKDSENVEFCFTLFGEGWKNLFPDVNREIKLPVDQKIVGRVSGKSPYGITGTMAALCAKVLLTEPENLPKLGGIYSTGAAFAKTSLIKQLKENGLHFEVISLSTTVSHKAKSDSKASMKTI